MERFLVSFQIDVLQLSGERIFQNTLTFKKKMERERTKTTSDEAKTTKNIAYIKILLSSITSSILNAVYFIISGVHK